MEHGEKNINTARKVYIIYLLYIFAGIVLMARLVQIQLTYSPRPEIAGEFHPNISKDKLTPERGSILSHDGRLLAMSIPMYQVRMDCTVMKEAHARDSVNGAEREALWLRKADTLSAGLARIYGDKSAARYLKDIKDGRKNGSKYLKIGYLIDHKTLKEVRSLPLFNEDPNHGGFLKEDIDTRKYPYGSLARRAIGYVRNNSENNHIGLEGKFDYYLHGTDGYQWMKVTDNRKKIQDYDSTSVSAISGYNLRTTLDIDIQDIADKALREGMADNPDIYGGCMVIMDVKTGAIRAMVNLRRDSHGRLSESINFAVGKAGEPGSVFKATTLMSLLEDGFVTLDTEIPTNGGKVMGYEARFGTDSYITNYEKRSGKKTITVRHCLELSSNYAFRQLAETYYGNEPKKLIEKLYRYKLGDEPMDFDINGLASPVLPNPENKRYWSKTDLHSASIGYTVKETPLHILTFYNAIANGGKMMKPYLVESIERGVDVYRQFYPTELSGSICSAAVADSLRSGLRCVVTAPRGTGHKELFGAYLPIAGKTGTAQMVIESEYSSGGKPTRETADGRRQYQATFVGFFPSDKPKYSAIVTMYTSPVIVKNAVYGGNNPARVFRTVADKIYLSDPSFGDRLHRSGSVPEISDSERKELLKL